MNNTSLINRTEDVLRIKEGTQGVYRVLTDLIPGKKYGIKVDPNSTYREYWCAAVDGDPKAIILSSDDCQDNRSIDIYKDGETLKWKPSGASTPSEEAPARKKGIFAVVWEKITGGDRST